MSFTFISCVQSTVSTIASSSLVPQALSCRHVPYVHMFVADTSPVSDCNTTIIYTNSISISSKSYSAYAYTYSLLQLREVGDQLAAVREELTAVQAELAVAQEQESAWQAYQTSAEAQLQSAAAAETAWQEYQVFGLFCATLPMFPALTLVVCAVLRNGIDANLLLLALILSHACEFGRHFDAHRLVLKRRQLSCGQNWRKRSQRCLHWNSNFELHRLRHRCETNYVIERDLAGRTANRVHVATGKASG